MARPIEPPPTGWQFPSVEEVDEHGLVAVGADLEPGTLLAAYRRGFFPMRVGPGRAMGWWSPDPRGVLEPRDVHVSRSLRRSLRAFRIRVDTSFDQVIEACADPARPHGWIDEQILDAYWRMHRLGWAHSVEAWHEGELAGGLYGIGIGAFFAGESMFHRRGDASKAALVALCRLYAEVTDALVDVQWATPHLVSMGASELSRTAYLARLEAALGAPGPDWPGPGE